MKTLWILGLGVLTASCSSSESDGRSPPQSPDAGQSTSGCNLNSGWPGDECEIENRRAESISFGQNEAATSEMCILVGDGVGPALAGLSDF